MIVDSRSELAPATVIKVHGVLRKALGDAERMDLIGRNVAKAVRPGSLPRSERRALTPAEATALLTELTGDRLEAVFVLAIATDLRRGEVLGLRWADVDLDERVLFVRQTLQRSAGELRFVAPKTHRSALSVPIPAFAVRGLQNHRVGQATGRLALESAWQDSGLVFTTRLGTPFEPCNVNRRFDAARRGRRFGLGSIARSQACVCDIPP